ncbi:MAG: hypothetical protein A3G80_11980 [Betaproteobacteria bacterium RIFCSPLOWO2_12_FULL_62_13b]|nr:MAG: hypothetical protein A3G80_11980 [Betaproteobacteria bacterium RIFCSPLOWO2_12_FULL_62_13b]
MKNYFRIPLPAGFALVTLLVLGVASLIGGKIPVQEAQAANDAYTLVGKPLPDIELRDRDGNVYPMGRLRGKAVVLFFSEGLMCYPACWNQIAAFATDPRFGGSRIVALSVVVDPPRVWQKALARMPELANATVLFDAGASVSRRLGFLSLESSMHPGQLPGHTYVLVDGQGVVREVIDDANMAVNNDLLIKLIAKLRR